MITRCCQIQLMEIVNKASFPKNVILLEGARQVGKTTLLSEVARGYQHSGVISLNLEEDRVLREKIDTSSSFSEFTKLLRDQYLLNPSEPQLLIIDEAQESDLLGSYLRFMKERWAKTTVILSGSSMTRLFRKDTRVPVGRYTSLKVYPFSFREFLSAAKREVLLEELDAFKHTQQISPTMHLELLKQYDFYLKTGGLPEVVLTALEGGDFALVRRQILLSQEDDFIRNTALADRKVFQLALRGIANHLGSPSKLTHVADAHVLARKVCELLQGWHLVHEIEQKGISSTTAFHPKRYLYDVGIAADLRNMPFPQLSVLDTLNSALRTQVGGISENAVLLNLLPYNMGNLELSSWKKASENPSEVDFVWRGRELIPIECKAALKISPRSFASLRNYMAESAAKFGLLVSAAPFSEHKEGSARLVNLPLYLCEGETILSLV
jgi:predicted AAA+ superfamily ATPase